MKKISLLVLFIAFTTKDAWSQTPVDSVKATIDKLFRAMKSSDAAALQECFADSAVLQTIGRNRSGATVIINEVVGDFVKQIGNMAKNAADERITYDVVKVDGPLAIAWTPYQFYYNGQFSHCGVNSFQLVRLNGVWKIQYLIDTRRKQGCE
jgi:hypothetical protein